MTILALDFDGARNLAVNMTVAMIVLREVAIDAEHALVDVDGGQMHSLLEFVRIVVGDEIAIGVEEIVSQIAFFHCPEIPAMTVVVGELRVLQRRVQIGHVAQEIDVRPLAADHSPLGIAIENLALLGDAQILLFLGPHEWRVGLVIPHRIAEVGVHEHVGLMHVAHHALAGWNGPRKLVLQRMPGLVFGDDGIVRNRFAVAAKCGVRTRVSRVPVVGVDDVAACATGRAVIAGLVVRSHEPRQRVVETGLVQVDQWHRYSSARASAAIGLPIIGFAGFLESLQQAEHVRQAGFRKEIAQVSATVFEYTGDVAGIDGYPGWERREYGSD